MAAKCSPTGARLATLRARSTPALRRSTPSTRAASSAPLEQRTDLVPTITQTFVRTGVSVMPPFRKTEISDADLAALAAYLAPRAHSSARVSNVSARGILMTSHELVRAAFLASAIFIATSVAAQKPPAAPPGAAAYQNTCAVCHDAGVPRAPTRAAFAAMAPEQILLALENGSMITMAITLSS